MEWIEHFNSTEMFDDENVAQWQFFSYFDCPILWLEEGDRSSEKFSRDATKFCVPLELFLSS